MMLILLLSFTFSDATHERLGFRYERQYKNHVQNAIRAQSTRCIPCGEKIVCTDLSVGLINFCKQQTPGEAAKNIFQQDDSLRYSVFVRRFNSAKSKGQAVKVPEYPLSERAFRQNRNAREKNSDYLSYYQAAYATKPIVTEPAPAPPTTTVAPAPEPIVQPIAETPPPPPPEKMINCTYPTIGRYLENPDFCECASKAETKTAVSNLALRQCKDLTGVDYKSIRECTADLTCLNRRLQNNDLIYNNEKEKIYTLKARLRGPRCQQSFIAYVEGQKFEDGNNTDAALYNFYKSIYAPKMASIVEEPQNALNGEAICTRGLVCAEMIKKGGYQFVDSNYLQRQLDPKGAFAFELTHYSRMAKVIPSNEMLCNAMLDNWEKETLQNLDKASVHILNASQNLSSCKGKIEASGETLEQKISELRLLNTRAQQYEAKERSCRTGSGVSSPGDAAK